MNALRAIGRTLVCIIGLTTMISGAETQPSSVPPTASSMILPQGNWSGTWLMSKDQGSHNPYASCCLGPGDWIPLTPKYRKIRDDFAKLPEYTVEKNTDNLADCISPGVPGQLEHPSRFEFLIAPGRVTVIHEEGTVRRIWTDGREFPKDLKPSPQGYSLGHWDDNGATLVVQTRAIAPTSDLFMVGPIKVTTHTRVTERFSLRSPKSMALQVTVDDSQIFTRPYTYTRTFMKIPGDFEVGCNAYNRDDGHDGNIDLTPPPEALAAPN